MNVETKITPLIQCPEEYPAIPKLSIDAAAASKSISYELSVQLLFQLLQLITSITA